MRTIRIHAKCSDCCGIEFNDTIEDISKQEHGYVPRNLGIGGGDYVDITINIDSGNVIGWDYPENDDIIEEMDKT